MSRYPDLSTRVFTATAGAAVLILGTWYGPWSYLIIFSGISGFTLWEFYGLVTNPRSKPLKIWGTLLGCSLVILFFLGLYQVLSLRYLLLLTPLGFFIFIAKLYNKTESNPFYSIANTWLGIMYISVPFCFIHLVALAPGYFEPELILGTLLLHWAHDVGAYFSGVRWGRTRLFERWSPKKSWEGSIGGATLALLVAWIGSYWAQSLSSWHWLTMAVIIIVAGTFGDLVESQFKRSLALKDSGRSIPGHGGFLDRFDGLLLSAPLIGAFLQLIFA